MLNPTLWKAVGFIVVGITTNLLADRAAKELLISAGLFKDPKAKK